MENQRYTGIARMPFFGRKVLLDYSIIAVFNDLELLQIGSFLIECSVDRESQNNNPD